jgi:membrane protein
MKIAQYIKGFQELVRRNRQRAERLLAALRIPGAQGVSVLDVLKLLVASLRYESFTLKAYGMAFNFFLAFFPTVILLFLVLPRIPIPHLETQLREALYNTLPADTLPLIDTMLDSVFHKTQNASVFLLTILAVFFFARRGVTVMMQAFRKADPEFNRRRSFLQTQQVTLTLFAGLGLLLVFGVAIQIGGLVVVQFFADQLGMANFWRGLLVNFTRHSLIMLFLIAGASFIYRVAPSVERKWRRLNPGGIVAGVLLYIAQLLLQFYFSSFASFNRVYGSLAAVMVLLVWMYWISVVLLLGFELNVSLRKAVARQRAEKSGLKGA